MFEYTWSWAPTRVEPKASLPFSPMLTKFNEISFHVNFRFCLLGKNAKIVQTFKIFAKISFFFSHLPMSYTYFSDKHLPKQIFSRSFFGVFFPKPLSAQPVVDIDFILIIDKGEI